MHEPSTTRFNSTSSLEELLRKATDFGAVAQALLLVEANANSLFAWQTRYHAWQSMQFDLQRVRDDWRSLYVFAATSAHGFDSSVTPEGWGDVYSNGVHMFSSLSKWHKHDYWDVGSKTRAVVCGS